MNVGTKVSKVSGDYRFDGVVVAVFPKLSGEVRIVVEDDRGVLFIARPDQYEVKPECAWCLDGTRRETTHSLYWEDKCRSCGRAAPEAARKT